MKSVSYKIETEVPISYMDKLMEFIQKKYLAPQKERFQEIAKKKNAIGNALSYTIIGSQDKPLMQVEVKGTLPIEVNVSVAHEDVTETVIEQAKQDIIIAVKMFEQNARKSMLYFAWREGEKIVPESMGKSDKSIQRLFLETQVLFFILFTGLGAILFFAILVYYPNYFVAVPLILVATQFIFVFYSTWFIARTGDWSITKTNPTIHLLEYSMPLTEKGEFRKGYSPEQITKIKKEIYDEILSKHGEINYISAQKIFEKHNIPCQPENLSSKTINVYELVKQIADKFHFPVPRIVVANTIMPNAAASGPSPSRGLVLITTGLLVQLDENEVRSVLGHEFGHLRGRDPILLYGITSAEYLFRFYVILNFLPIIFSTFLFFIYIWLVFSVIFFISKFFEARADLVSAIVIGQPKILADALEKIGFQRLLFERTPSFRLQEWVGFDPHPPISFRVERLEQLKNPSEIRHPLLRSIREVISGFFATLS